MAKRKRPSPSIWCWPIVLTGAVGFAFLGDERVHAHGGGTNASGCHTKRSTGDYHCHGSGSSSRSTGSSSYRPYRSWLYYTPAPATIPLRSRCDANGCTITNIEPIQPTPAPQPKPKPSPQEETSPPHQWATEQELPASPGSQGAAAEAQDLPAPAAAQQPAATPPTTTTTTAAPVTSQQSANGNGEPLASVSALGAGVLVGVFLYRLLRHQRRAGKVLRAANAINNQLQRDRTLLFGCTKEVLAVTSATAKGDCLLLQALQLDYSQHDRLSTCVVRHHLEIPAALLPLHGGLGRLRCLPKALPVEKQWFWALEGDTEYHALVVQHHKAWSMLLKMVDVEVQLKKQLNKLVVDGQKYVQSEAVPRAQETIQEMAAHKSKQLEQICTEIPQLETMLSLLTLRIESIEDFGGILLGYERPDDYGNHVMAERELVMIEEVREQFQQLQAQLEAYAELVNLT